MTYLPTSDPLLTYFWYFLVLFSTFWLHQELKESQCPSVRSLGSNLSRALNLHHSGSGLFQVSLRSLSGLSQVSLRSFSQLSDLSQSDRRSLKYFVLLCNIIPCLSTVSQFDVVVVEINVQMLRYSLLLMVLLLILEQMRLARMMLLRFEMLQFL